MQSKNIDITIEVIEDQEGTKLFLAIKDNNLNKLQQLIEHGADITLLQDGKTCLQVAAELGHWQCFEMLEEFNKSLKNFEKSSDCLVAAAKFNQTSAINKFKVEGKKFFFKKGVGLFSSRQPCIDDENGFTSLHWAVKNNNPEACELILKKYLNNPSVYYPEEYMCDGIKVFGLCKVKNFNNQTAYDLAISLDHLSCAKEIAKYHNWDYVKTHSSIDVIYKTLFHDIYFGMYFLYRGIIDYSNVSHENPTSIIHINKYRNKKDLLSLANKIFGYIKTLDESERKEALTKMLDPSTPLGGISNNLKFKKCIIEELKNVNHHSNKINKLGM